MKRPRSSSLPTKQEANVEETGYQSDSAKPQEQREIKFTDKTKEWRKNCLRHMSPPPVGNDNDEDNVTDLVLIMHGIGQGVRRLLLCQSNKILTFLK